ncbi:MAG: hypothetical protein ACPLTR_11325 [Thermacetogeniaceae bacterium]
MSKSDDGSTCPAGVPVTESWWSLRASTGACGWSSLPVAAI